jgi:N-methylhydantoinase B
LKFSSNGLYIEEYIKCANCGVLIYETDLAESVEIENKGLFCSQWCVDWSKAREDRVMESA